MPENMFDKKWSAMLPPETVEEKRERERRAKARREQREREDAALKLWGYKPWERKDRRKRPLRTKRAWVSFRARLRECEIIKLRFKCRMTFREIGDRLKISHVAAWKRFEWAWGNHLKAERYRESCLEEIAFKCFLIEKLETELAHLPADKRERIYIESGLIPERCKKRLRNCNHNG